MKRRRLSLVFAVAAITGAVPFAAAAQGAGSVPPRATIPTPVPSPVLPAVPSVAPGYKAPEAAPSSANVAGVAQQPFVGINLNDAIGMALVKNPNLAISASNFTISHYQIAEAKGPFDVRLQVEPSSSFSVEPPINLFEAGPGVATVIPSPPPSGPTTINNPGNITQHQSSFQYGLGGQTVNGTQFSAGILQQRTFNNTVLNTYNPYYLASLNVSVTQPLLRNFGMNAAKRQYKISFVNSQIDGAQALIDASSTISQVEDAYWDLVSAWRNVAIQETALKDAIAQQQSNVRLAKRGAAAPIDAVESSTQVAIYQDQVFSALQTVSELQTQLKGLIVSDPGDPIWRANLIPTSSVVELSSAPTVDSIVATALRDRPEVIQALEKRYEADIDRAYAKNQELPQADVQATYESNGFAGLPQPLPSRFAGLACVVNANFETICPQTPADTRGTMPFAYHNLWAGAFPTFNIGVLVSFPLHNDVAKGLKGVASQEEYQAALLEQSVVTRIGAEARNAVQAYESSLSRLNSARQAREAAEQVYASEQRRFRNGMSTTFLVLQRQTELNQARGRELLAQTDLNKAVVEVQRVEGTILTANNVNLQTLGTQALPSPSPAAAKPPGGTQPKTP